MPLHSKLLGFHSEYWTVQGCYSYASFEVDARAASNHGEHFAKTAVANKNCQCCIEAL